LSRILFLSNGHGEDLSGALVANALEKLGHEVKALPLVGKGESYLKEGIKVIGKTRSFSTGGMGYTSLKGRILELIQGQVIYLIKRIYLLFLSSSKYDLLVVVGDVLPVTLAWLTGLPVATYLVAYSSHYEGRLKLPWPCSNCLSSDNFLKIFTRDKLTAEDLNKHFYGKVEFIGNPFMDPFLTNSEKLPKHNKRLGILPGSRMPEVGENLCLILRVVDYISNLKCENTDISFDVALVPSLDDFSLENLVIPDGWRLCYPTNNYDQLKLIKNHSIVNIYRDSFVKVVQSSKVLVSMAGTATEQAALLGKLIVQLEGKGPQFNASFAEAQRRLLGSNIYCANGSVKKKKHMITTSKLILDLLEKTSNDGLFIDKNNNAILEKNKVQLISDVMAKSITNSFF
tara:strand:- start:7 stop:1206 length:1200 start_codon:yes stop_codon:yes gene_type:complete